MAVVSTLGKLRVEAAELEAEGRASGKPISHSAALEQVAKRHGYDSWHACHAAFSDARLPSTGTNPFETRRYRSSEWNFSLDVPTRWIVFPPVHNIDPGEVVRFASHEDGYHMLKVSRRAYDPEQSPEDYSKLMQRNLERLGFSNFVPGTKTFGSRRVVTLNFDKPAVAALTSVTVDGDATWSCSHYYMVDGTTLAYVLGVGTVRWADMSDLFDRMAQSFSLEYPTGPAQTPASSGSSRMRREKRSR